MSDPVGRLLDGSVTAVSRSARDTLSKANEKRIRLRTGLGVDGDAHMGETVKHRSRAAKDPTLPNLRQVHLLHAGLHDELRPGDPVRVELPPGLPRPLEPV